MMTLRHGSCITDTVHSINAFNLNDDYYNQKHVSSKMEILQAIFSEISHPAFAIHRDNRKIYYTNYDSISNSQLNWIGKNIDEAILTYDDVLSGGSVAYLNNEWLSKTERTITWKEDSYSIVEFKKRHHIPDTETLDSWKSMIAVMIHRFRSPLTGVSGYMDMLQPEISNGNSEKYFTMINKGLDNVYDMMDELELLYNIPTNYGEENSIEVSARSVIHNTILDVDTGHRQKITTKCDGEDLLIKCNPKNLARIIEILVKNALDHSSGNNSDVSVSITEKNTIEVSNFGTPIEESFSRTIFRPFVTSKAKNLGIGLTMAVLYANQFGGTILLSSNNEKQGIVFSICFPDQ